jgi:hypothetical protein
MQMLVGVNGRCMLAIFPERALLAFSLVVLLRRATSDELHALTDHV